MIYPPNQTPPIWSIDPGIIAYNCQKAGMPYPVSAIPMWEGAGKLARDYSGHGTHGTILGGTTWANEGLIFGGNGDYVSCGDTVNSLLSSTSYSVATWMKTNTISENNMMQGYRSTKSLNPILFQLDHNNDDVRFIVRDDAGHIAFGIKNDAIIANKFYYVVGVRDGGTLNVYVNCVVGTSDTDTFGTITANSYNIGAVTPGGVPQNNTMFNGTIMGSAIFNSALSPSQIKFMYNDPWFMYRMPEELYGYVAGAPPVGAIMNQFQKSNVGADLYNGAIIA